MSVSETEAAQAAAADVGRIQMNTSGVIDKAIEIDGAEKVLSDLEATWNEAREDGLYDGQIVPWAKGVEGIHDAWTRMVAGIVSGVEFAAVRMT
jgi:tagatose-1,6-bisphosphate aldolase non-catalytic subunit AgaZ/GatZ